MAVIKFFLRQTLPVIDWSPHPDLNRGPLPYQGSALPLSYVGSSISGDRRSFRCRSCHYRSAFLPGAGDGNRTHIISLEG